MEEYATLISWALVLVLMFAGPRLPGGLYFWTAIVMIVVLFMTISTPNANWPFQMAFIVLYVVGRHLVKTKLRSALSGDSSAAYDTRGSGREKLIGRVVPLSRAIRSGRGGILIRNDPWVVSGENMPEGTKVRVVGLDGDFLRVERAE